MSDPPTESETADPYQRLAPFYDEAMSGFEDDIELYASLARAQAGPVLELGAGTGRVARVLAARGATVIALDRSTAMLELAGGAGDQLGKVRVVRGDMRVPPLRGRYGLAILARDTFLHLTSRADQLRCLRAVRTLLQRDGILVLDLPGPGGDLGDWEPGARPLVLDWTRLTAGNRLSRFVGFSANLAEQAHDVTDVYEQIDADGGVRRTVVEYRLRLCFPEEALLLLEAAGLRCTHRYGGYEMEPFSAASERMILLAQPAGGVDSNS